jgi:dipeptide/tripeptide permease
VLARHKGLLLLVTSVVVPGLSPGPDQEHSTMLQSGMLFFALYTIALGTGGIKPNVSAFVRYPQLPDPTHRPLSCGCGKAADA